MKDDKILKTITDTILEKKRQELFESIKNTIKDEWDEIEWDIQHPSKELCDIAKATREAYQDIDKGGIETITIKL